MSESMTAVVVAQFGGPEVLEVREAPTPSPTDDQVLIDVAYAGVNFAEIMSRRFGSLGVEPPFVPGMEVSGTVVAVGAEVRDFAVGDRVCALTRTGGYAQRAVAEARLTFA